MFELFRSNWLDVFFVTLCCFVLLLKWHSIHIKQLCVIRVLLKKSLLYHFFFRKKITKWMTRAERKNNFAYCSFIVPEHIIAVYKFCQCCFRIFSGLMIIGNTFIYLWMNRDTVRRKSTFQTEVSSQKKVKYRVLG